MLKFAGSPDQYAQTYRVISLGLFFFSIGVLFSSFYHNFSAIKELNKIKLQPLKDPWRKPVSMHAIFCLCLCGFALSFLYFYHAGGIPAFAALVETARVEATRGGGYFWLGISILLPFVCLIFIGKALAYKSKKITVQSALFFLITSLIMFFTATKDLIPFFLLWIVFFFQFYSGRINKKLLLVPFISLAIAIAMAGFTMSHKLEVGYNKGFFSFALEMFSQRVFFAVVNVVHFIVENFPEKYPFLLGYSYWMNLRAALPGADIGFGGWINMEAFNMGGGATVPMIAEFYANFGELGAYSGMLLAGFIVQSIYIYLLRSLATEKRLDTLISITFLGMGLVTLAINSVFGYLFYTLIPVLACFCFLKFLCHFLTDVVYGQFTHYGVRTSSGPTTRNAYEESLEKP